MGIGSFKVLKIQCRIRYTLKNYFYSPNLCSVGTTNSFVSVYAIKSLSAMQGAACKVVHAPWNAYALHTLHTQMGSVQGQGY